MAQITILDKMPIIFTKDIQFMNRMKKFVAKEGGRDLYQAMVKYEETTE